MGWVKLDDDFPMHPKVVGLSDEAFRAYINTLCYAAKYETDGVVPNAIAPNGSAREELLAAGLWESGKSVRIHDFLSYNPSHAERTAKRTAASNAASMRWGTGSGLGLGGFEQFWSCYPRRVGKPRARVAFERALRQASAEDIISGAKRYAEDPNRDDEFTAHPTTWLNREGWNDDPLPKRKQRRREGVLDQSAREAMEEMNAKRTGRGSGHRSAGELPG